MRCISALATALEMLLSCHCTLPRHQLPSAVLIQAPGVPSGSCPVARKAEAQPQPPQWVPSRFCCCSESASGIRAFVVCAAAGLSAGGLLSRQAARAARCLLAQRLGPPVFLCVPAQASTPTIRPLSPRMHPLPVGLLWLPGAWCLPFRTHALHLLLPADA